MTEQARDLANTIARQAQALADGNIPEGQVYAQLSRLADNVATLRAWVPDDRATVWPKRDSASVAR